MSKLSDDNTDKPTANPDPTNQKPNNQKFIAMANELKSRIVDIINAHNIKVDKIIGYKKDRKYPWEGECVWIHQNGLKYFFGSQDADEHLETVVINTLD